MVAPDIDGHRNRVAGCQPIGDVEEEVIVANKVVIRLVNDLSGIRAQARERGGLEYVQQVGIVVQHVEVTGIDRDLLGIAKIA